MKIRRTIFIFAAVLLAAAMLCSCGSAPASAQDEDSLKIVVTIFPEYDWVRNIVGNDTEGADITLLIDSGVDLHSFQPSAEDIMKISTCDVFIYVGGTSDAWVEDALKTAVNRDMAVISLMDELGSLVKEEELVEGMQGDGEEEETEYDEHVWLSLRNASYICNRITDVLSEKDPEKASVYAANNEAYQEKLSALDSEYQNAVDSAEFDTLIFGDRFPFRYLTDDYGLKYYAAFAGCSAETEASFETVIFLADKLNELGLKNVCRIETSDGAIAKTITDTAKSGAGIVVFDSMQSVTANDMENGTTYLSVMESNLNKLKEALN